MYIQGTYDTRWVDSLIFDQFKLLKASDFEVIQLGWKPTYPAPSGPLDYYTLTPCRLLDTRQAYGPTGGPALPLSVPRVFVAAGRCGIPANAKALAVNIAVSDPPGFGNVRLFPGNFDTTSTSTINFTTGVTRANNAIVPLATSGSGTFALQSSVAGVHVAVDVMGYFL
jgi:hypothetical protein